MVFDAGGCIHKVVSLNERASCLFCVCVCMCVCAHVGVFVCEHCQGNAVMRIGFYLRTRAMQRNASCIIFGTKPNGAEAELPKNEYIIIYMQIHMPANAIYFV